MFFAELFYFQPEVPPYVQVRDFVSQRESFFQSEMGEENSPQLHKHELPPHYPQSNLDNAGGWLSVESFF